MSIGDILGVVGLVGAITLVLAYLTERDRATKAEADAETWKRLALERRDRIVKSLEETK